MAGFLHFLGAPRPQGGELPQDLAEELEEVQEGIESLEANIGNRIDELPDLPKN